MFKLIKESKESKLFDLFDYVSTLYLGLFTAKFWLKHTHTYTHTHSFISIDEILNYKRKGPKGDPRGDPSSEPW